MKSNSIINDIVNSKNIRINIPKLKSGKFYKIKYEHSTKPNIKTGIIKITQLLFFGLCIFCSKTNLTSRLVVRNILNKKAVELNVYVYSPYVLNITEVKIKKVLTSKAKLFFLRNKKIRVKI